MGEPFDSRDIYECIFYTKKLGLNFKFQNQRAFVISYDEEEFNASFTVQEPKANSSRPQVPQNIGKVEDWNVYKDDPYFPPKETLHTTKKTPISIAKPASVPTATMVIPGLNSPTPKPTATSVVVVGTEVSFVNIQNYINLIYY